MIDATKVLKVLPLLVNYGKDVESWITEFEKIMNLYDITEPRQVFTWIKEAVEEDALGPLNALVMRKNNEIRYPTMREVQLAIEDHMNITDSDKCSILKALKISNDETIKTFNYRYRKLYNKLSLDYRKLIAVKDYTNAISSRVFACSKVITSECDTLNEAFKTAELAEEAEKEIAQFNQINHNYNTMGTPLMITQHVPYNNPLLLHPIYTGMQLGAMGNNNNLYNTIGYNNNNNTWFNNRRNIRLNKSNSWNGSSGNNNIGYNSYNNNPFNYINYINNRSVPSNNNYNNNRRSYNKNDYQNQLNFNNAYNWNRNNNPYNANNNNNYNNNSYDNNNYNNNSYNNNNINNSFGNDKMTNNMTNYNTNNNSIGNNNISNLNNMINNMNNMINSNSNMINNNNNMANNNNNNNNKKLLL